jgi:hypothetical protein
MKVFGRSKSHVWQSSLNGDIAAKLHRHHELLLRQTHVDLKQNKNHCQRETNRKQNKNHFRRKKIMSTWNKTKIIVNVTQLYQPETKQKSMSM